MTVKAIPKRTETPDHYQWNLDDLYPSQEAWEADLASVKAILPQVAAMSGMLNTAQSIRKCFEMSDNLNELLERLYVFAHLKHDEDTGSSAHQGPVNLIKTLAVQVGETLSFIDPEIVSLPEEMLRRFIEDPDLTFYRFTLEDKLRQKPHTLPKEQEALLAKAGLMAQAPQTIYSMLNNADMKFPSIRDEGGNEIELTHARYGRLMESRDRRVRKDAFEAMFSSYEKLKHTMASTFNANVQKNIFFAQALHFDSALHMALFGDNIPREVYLNLIGAIREGLPIFHRYLDIRRRALGIGELHMYDLSVPIVADIDWVIPYDEASSMVTEALAPLGKKYIDTVQQAWKSRWIDVYENSGKRSGAYSWGVYGVHPYILLNHEDTLDAMFTIAHEMGHAMHSHLADAHQRFRYAGYTIFIAEIASTLNEALLMNFLLKQTTDPKRRGYLLTHYADNFRGTVFVQTMFAEFEMRVHEIAERGEALTLEVLSDLYDELHTVYYGDHVILDKPVRYGWMRIPHFYQSFYVFKYATGFSAANAFARRIVEGSSNGAANEYLELLKSGGKDYSLNLLRHAGLDMTTPQPIKEAIAVFDHILDELDQVV